MALLPCQSRLSGSSREDYFDLFYRLGPLDITDGCECACSEQEGGRYPLTVFLATYCRSFRPRDALEQAEPILKVVCGLNPDDIFASCLSFCVRFLTFQELGKYPAYMLY